MRTKIDYGIDLGTTNSAIARIENGVPVIKKSDTLKDTVPSCVSFVERKTGIDVLTGDAAMNRLQNDYKRSLNTLEKEKSNTFIEFKRTMGTNILKDCAILKRSLSSEELSAEVLKKLKSFIQDEDVSSVVVTVPAKFQNQQCEATMKAAKLAGFKQVQLLQEPVAAATAYGLGSQSKDGFWLVFDFGGGTFDAALVKSEEGILSVKDTEGDNRLGGKNLDEAIVDQVLIPYLEGNYSIDFLLNDNTNKQILRSALKQCAEEVKIQLSFKEKDGILTQLGDLREDENGEDMEIDIEVSRDDLEKVCSYLFQKAIDITKDLLRRNNLKGSHLNNLILVGGPTHSPILRKMLCEQITENIDTLVDPMTVVACGAALYASTIDVTDEIRDETRDETKLQLEVKYEAASVETYELVNIKVLKEKSAGTYPEELFAEFVRTDGAWSSSKTKISDKKVVLVEVVLSEGRPNAFNIHVYDGQGNRIDCEPNQFTILQGIGGLDGMQVLPSHICIVKHFANEEKDLILPVKGLEKNNRYPATGVVNGLKTRQTIRPGIATDIIRIPIYEGEHNAEGTNPDLNNLIFEVVITGESIPALLPEGSDVDITIKVDKSGLMKFSAYFPLLDYPEELEIPIKVMEAPEVGELERKIGHAKRTALKINADDISTQLDNLENQLENEKGNPDGEMKILDGLRKELLKLETLEKAQEWFSIEKKLRDIYFKFENLVGTIKRNGLSDKLNINNIDSVLKEMKQKADVAIRDKKCRDAKELTTEIYWLGYNLHNELTGGLEDIRYLQFLNENFGQFNWKDAIKARQLINKGLQIVASGNNNVRPILAELVQLIPRDELPKDTLG